MLRLGVNVDHIATLRQARREKEPDPVTAALLAELAGADGIVAHLREDRRHIRDRDIRLLRELISTSFNMEMAATEEMVRIAREIKPDLVTLVPERREELTTEGGLDVVKHHASLQKSVSLLLDAGIRVSLFIDPDPEQIRAGKTTGAGIIEIHTGRYAKASSMKDREIELEAIRKAASFAQKADLAVSAGHGLNFWNVSEVARIPEIEELNIGHSIISRASLVGIVQAVREMKALLQRQS